MNFDSEGRKLEKEPSVALNQSGANMRHEGGGVHRKAPLVRSERNANLGKLAIPSTSAPDGENGAPPPTAPTTNTNTTMDVTSGNRGVAKGFLEYEDSTWGLEPVFSCRTCGSRNNGSSNCEVCFAHSDDLPDDVLSYLSLGRRASVRESSKSTRSGIARTDTDSSLDVSEDIDMKDDMHLSSSAERARALLEKERWAYRSYLRRYMSCMALSSVPMQNSAFSTTSEEDSSLNDNRNQVLMMLPLDAILNDPMHFKMLKLFAEAQQCPEPLWFWERVVNFSLSVEKEGPAAALPLARKIFEEFFGESGTDRMGAPFLSTALSNNVKKAIDTGQIDANVFRHCKREAEQIVEMSLRPAFLSFAKSVLSSRSEIVPDSKAFARVSEREPLRRDSFGAAVGLEAALLGKEGSRLGFSRDQKIEEDMRVVRDWDERLKAARPAYRSYLDRMARVNKGKGLSHYQEVDLPMSLVLRDPIHFQMLRLFAEARECSEIVYFWERVQEFRHYISENGSRAAAPLAYNIWQNFMDPNSQKATCLSFSNGVAITVKNDLEDGFVSARVFDTAEKHVEKLLVALHPPFLSFVNSIRTDASLAVAASYYITRLAPLPPFFRSRSASFQRDPKSPRSQALTSPRSPRGQLLKSPRSPRGQLPKSPRSTVGDASSQGSLRRQSTADVQVPAVNPGVEIASTQEAGPNGLQSEADESLDLKKTGARGLPDYGDVSLVSPRKPLLDRLNVESAAYRTYLDSQGSKPLTLNVIFDDKRHLEMISLYAKANHCEEGLAFYQCAMEYVRLAHQKGDKTLLTETARSIWSRFFDSTSVDQLRIFQPSPSLKARIDQGDCDEHLFEIEMSAAREAIRGSSYLGFLQFVDSVRSNPLLSETPADIARRMLGREQLGALHPEEELERSNSFGPGVAGMTSVPVVRGAAELALERTMRLNVERRSYALYLRNHFLNVDDSVGQALPLDLTLSDPVHYKMLRLFAEAHNCGECVHLWQSVSGFLSFQKDSAETLAFAREIYSKFLDSDVSPAPVFVNPRVVTELKQAITRDNVDVAAFYSLKREATRTIALSLYPEFLAWVNAILTEERGRTTVGMAEFEQMMVNSSRSHSNLANLEEWDEHPFRSSPYKWLRFRVLHKFLLHRNTLLRIEGRPVRPPVMEKIAQGMLGDFAELRITHYSPPPRIDFSDVGFMSEKMLAKFLSRYDFEEMERERKEYSSSLDHLYVAEALTVQGIVLHKIQELSWEACLRLIATFLGQWTVYVVVYDDARVVASRSMDLEDTTSTTTMSRSPTPSPPDSPTPIRVPAIRFSTSSSSKILSHIV